MGNPPAVPGMCPYYNPGGSCYLSGSMPDSGHRDAACMSKSNWTTCGNYEAKRSGRNYTDR
jgi:hypothetical protein